MEHTVKRIRLAIYGDDPFSGENPLKIVLPQTPFLNFELRFDCPDFYRDNQTQAQSLGGGETLFKGSPPQEK